MKPLHLILLLVLTISCSKDDDKEYKVDSFYESMVGRYRLTKMYTDVPIDVNFDGASQTNMLQEIDCHLSIPFGLYYATFEYQYSYGERLDLAFNVANSQTYSEEIPMQQCFLNDQLMYIGILINKTSGEIIINERSINESEYGTLTYGRYENHKFYLDVDKIIFTSEGWQTIPMYFEYEWYSK